MKSISKEQWLKIRQAYNAFIPLIMHVSREKGCDAWYNPYEIFSWHEIFTPIEEITWEILRANGVPMYPQFPIGGMFVDFANPYLRIGLEVDGKAYHCANSDKKRDKQLVKLGWKIYRITGKECVSKLEEPDERHYGYDYDYGYDYLWKQPSNERYNWIMQSCDGVIKALKNVYFSPVCLKGTWEYYQSVLSLRKHQLVKFEIEDIRYYPPPKAQMI